MMENINNIIEKMKRHDLAVPPIRRSWNCTADIRRILKNIGATLVPDFTWIKEYDCIAEFLTCNGGKGLFLFGNCGVGKSMFLRYIIPAFMLQNFDKVMKTYYIKDIDDLKDIKNKWIISIDDIGVESVKNVYGNKIDIFSEIVEHCEANGILLFCTSNLTPEKLLEKYDQRTLDRLIALCKFIEIKTKSFRK